jgi:PAS domain S-box-containing protein
MADSLIDKAPVILNRRAQFRRESDAENDHLARLIALLPEAILCCNTNWTITYANAEAVRISRIQPSDINTKTHWQLFPETVGTDLERTYRNVMQTRVAEHIEYFYAPFDIWLDVHIIPSDEGVALYYRDVTDRKRAESLRDSAVRQLQQIFDVFPDSIVCIDRQWNCTFANRAALAILKTDTLIGENLWNRFPSNRQEPFLSNYRTTMERRIPTEFEAYYAEPLDIWFKVFVRPYEDGIIIFSSDITDRKGAELLRDASARQLRQVLEITTDAVVSFNHDWNFTFLNRRAKELLSPKGELLGKNLWEEFPAAAQPDSDYYYHCHRAMDEGIPSEFEAFYPEPINLWLSIQCRPYEGGMVVFFRDVTARRESDLVLHRQQDLLASVQQTARAATWDIDYATGNATYGAGSYPVFGHPLAVIPDARAFKKILLPEYLPIIANAVQAAVETGQMIVVECQIRGADGQVLWIENRGQIVSVDGKPTSLRGLTIDITDRKKNEEALVTSEARYRVLADLNPQAIWMGAPDGSITYANQGFLDYIGLTIETLSRDNWLNAFHPHDRQRVIDAWTHSVATGDEYDLEARLIRARDGQSRWWWLRAQVVRDSGKILHWLGVAIDIDDRKTFAETLQKRQEETERQRAELESIYQTAPVGLALFNAADLRYLRINDRQVEIIGLPREKILGRVITDVVSLPGLKELLETAAAGHPVRNQLLQGELPGRPSEQRSFNVSYSPVFNADGTVEAIAAVVLEITNQKKAEIALIQSEKLAAVGRLASSISHEINNPLEAITNLLYLIGLSTDLTEASRNYLQTAQSELSRVCQIATQTLRFHRQAVRATRVSAADLVNAVLNLYQGRLANSHIEVDARYSTDTTVLCFENDIRQVLNNLIANAIDAMRSGGRLIVRAHDATDYSPEYLQPRPGIRITIADTGHGMSPTVKSRLFEPFYTTKDLNGTGLGLWISSGIVSRHQGRLTYRSTDDPVRHGTIFSLFLPWAEVVLPTTS